MSVRISLLVIFGFLATSVVCQETPQLVILLADHGTTNRNGSIKKIHIHHMNLTILNISNVILPVAIDFDKQDNHIYWTDIGTKQVRRAGIDGENDTVVANLNSVSSPEGLTLDNNTRQVFYTDLGTKTITKIDMTSLNTTVIISTGLDKPRGIIADTRNRKLYWVDQGNNTKIETCNYNGEQRRTLVSSGLIEPNGITLDEQTGRLFWTDGVGRIESIFVNGTGRKISLKTATRISLHDIASFNGFLYFTISRSPHIFTLSEVFNQTHLSYLRSRLFNDPTGIHIFSPNIDISVPCPYGQYGLACTKCGACSGDSPCEKMTGICLSGCSAGYKGDKCTEVCDRGTFGDNCKSTCSIHCKTRNVCDRMTGHCSGGCASGWMGNNCTISNRGVTDAPTAGSTGSSVGMIVGIVVAGIVLLALIVTVAVFFIRKYRGKTESYVQFENDMYNSGSVSVESPTTTNSTI